MGVDTGVCVDVGVSVDTGVHSRSHHHSEVSEWVHLPQSSSLDVCPSVRDSPGPTALLRRMAARYSGWDSPK